jgi:hypothetical protein
MYEDGKTFEIGKYYRDDRGIYIMRVYRIAHGCIDAIVIGYWKEYVAPNAYSSRWISRFPASLGTQWAMGLDQARFYTEISEEEVAIYKMAR